jgi:tetratricopeptide (TPR) repeat protein
MFSAAIVVSVCQLLNAPSADPPAAAHNFDLATITTALNDARAIALKQDKSQDFWTSTTLLNIGKVEIRARDFDGAVRSIRSSTYDYGRNSGMIDVAEALAGDGQRDRAVQTLGTIGGWRHEYLDDGVQMATVVHLIAKGDLTAAGQAADQVKSSRCRPEAMRRVAIANAKARNIDQAKKLFERSLESVAKPLYDSDALRAYCDVADAQLSLEWTADAKTTVKRLVEDVKLTDPWTRFCALMHSGELAAKANDHDGARRLFEKARAAQKDVDSLNTNNALEQLAMSLARSGFYEEARETWAGGQVQIAIVQAQLKAGDTAAAMRTTESTKFYRRDTDSARQAIVDHLLAKKDLDSALKMVETIEDPIEKAKASLRVAIAHARSGDRKTAAEIASRVKLSHQRRFEEDRVDRFDFRDPATWGVHYEEGFTMMSWHFVTERAAQISGLSMTLANLLSQRPTQPYAKSFSDIRSTEIVRALARAHAATGDAQEALAWARQIGTDGKVDAKEIKSSWEIAQRIDALVGAAEGMLDRMGVPPSKPR